jgi:hypothetical protein
LLKVPFLEGHEQGRRAVLCQGLYRALQHQRGPEVPKNPRHHMPCHGGSIVVEVQQAPPKPLFGTPSHHNHSTAASCSCTTLW